MQVYNKNIINGVVMNTTINSLPYDVQQIYGYAIQATFTGTPTGSFKLQASNDPATSYNNQSASQVVNWTDIVGTPYSVTAAGNYMWNVYDVMYNWVRLVYTDTSGGTSTAVLNATINAKAP
jgi:hypothetical protein